MTPLELHRDRLRRGEAEVANQARRSARLSNLRGVSFAAFAIGLAWAAFGAPAARSSALALAGGGLLAFVLCVARHRLVLEREDFARRRVRVSGRAVARLEHRFRDLPEDGAGLLPDTHPYADDVDLLGPSSLFQKLCTAHTRWGQVALARLLGEPAALGVARERQRVVRQLAGELEYREELEALALVLPDSKGRVARAPDPEPLVRWATAPPELSTRRWLRPLALVLGTWNPLAAVLVAFDLLPSRALALGIIGGGLVVLVTAEAAGRAFAAVSSTEGAFARYAGLLAAVERAPAEVRALIGGAAGEQGASHAMRRFWRIVGWFELKHNGLIHPFINIATLWDVRCVLALEAWQAEHGPRVRGWFETLGELEALASLAALMHDEPTFCLPELVDDRAEFSAEGLAHPLLAADARVGNDVALGGAGTALLITGSNMSGKSTFLRSIALGSVLAQAGGPVCARSARVGPAALRTSLRVRDSLASGASHFYAEVQKLKSAVDAASDGQPVLFLLDEILHGTNSHERQVGARWTLATLLERGATGVVTTHDEELCRLPEPLASRVVQKHFREDVSGDTMTFDYRLREGPVAGGNALRLMRRVGLAVPLHET